MNSKQRKQARSSRANIIVKTWLKIPMIIAGIVLLATVWFGTQCRRYVQHVTNSSTQLDTESLKINNTASKTVRLFSIKTIDLLNPVTTYQDGECVVSRYIRICPEDTQSTVTLQPDNTVSFTVGTSNSQINFAQINNIVGSKGDMNQDAFVGIADIGLFMQCFKGVDIPAGELCVFNPHYDCDDDVDLWDWANFQLAYGTGNVASNN